MKDWYRYEFILEDLLIKLLEIQLKKQSDDSEKIIQHIILQMTICKDIQKIEDLETKTSIWNDLFDDLKEFVSLTEEYINQL